jgi:hypothetical protein
MARQRTLSRSFTFIAGTTIAGIGLYILSVALAGPSDVFTSLLSLAVKEALGQLPSILPAALQTLQRHSLNHPQTSPCPLQMLVSCWLLVRLLAGAA